MESKIKAPGFVSFIVSPAGRIFRIVIGLAMIAAGVQNPSINGILLAVIGLVPLAAGAFDVCVLGKMFGGSFQGDKMRRALHEQQGNPALGDKSASFIKA